MTFYRGQKVSLGGTKPVSSWRREARQENWILRLFRGVSHGQSGSRPSPRRAGFEAPRRENSLPLRLPSLSWGSWKGKKSRAPEKEGEALETAFYRPGAGTLEQIRAGIRAQRPAARPKRLSFPKAGLWMARVTLLGALVVVVLWAKAKTTLVLQNVAGFKLGKVEVSGNHYLGAEELMRTAGFTPGMNMFQLNLEEARGRLEGLGWVERAYVERRLPQGILISVRERKPVALLDAGALYGVDREGRVLPPSLALAAEDLPILSGAGLGPEALGTTLAAQRLKPAMDFLVFLDKSDEALAADVSEVNLSEKETLKVTFLDGVEARFGMAAGDDELRRLASVLSDLSEKGKRASSLDFRYKNMVLVKTR